MGVENRAGVGAASENQEQGDALKDIRVQYETAEINDEDQKKIKLAERFENYAKSYKMWQEEDYLAQLRRLKTQDPNPEKSQKIKTFENEELLKLEEFGYRPSDRVVRIEQVSGTVEGINWSRKNKVSLYFYAEAGEYLNKYIKLEGRVGFGRKSEVHQIRNGWLLLDKDPKVSKEHFLCKVDHENSCVTIQDLGSQNGTWIALMQHVDERIVPKATYKSGYLGDFRFVEGARCNTVEHVLSIYNRMDLVDDFYEVDLSTVQKILTAVDANLRIIMQEHKVSSFCLIHESNNHLINSFSH